MGGVETDVWARTTLPGLFAAGEVACTGVHGANRLASNSLLEGLVFGARAAKAMLEPAKAGAMENVRVETTDAALQAASVRGRRSETRSLRRHAVDVRALMWTLGRPRHAQRHRVCKQRSTSSEVERDTSSLATVAGSSRAPRCGAKSPAAGTTATDFPAKDDVTLEVSHRPTDPWLINNRRRTPASSPKSRRSPPISPAGISTSSAAPSSPIIRRSKAAWSSGRTAMPSGSTSNASSTRVSKRPGT